MGIRRDGYSNFGFYNALPADIYTTLGAGKTIDMQGFGTATIVLNAYSLASGGSISAGNHWKVILQHGLASALGVSTWSNVPGSQIIHSVYGGYDSTAETGLWLSIHSATIAASTLVHAVGYKGDEDHRYLRLYLSLASAGASIGLWMGANAILGQPSNWPINTPVNIA